MDVFGDGEPHIIPISNEKTPFDLYRRISQVCSHSFLFESLTDPSEMAQTSVMGFNPSKVVRGYADRIEIDSHGSTKIVNTRDPLGALAGVIVRRRYNGQRYAGGAVGVVNYDAIRLIEDIPQSHQVQMPLFEFGVYNDGVLYDNDTAQMQYFWYDENRSHMLECDDAPRESFEATPPRSNMDIKEFTDIVDKAKRQIYRGDIFQVVLSRRFSFGASGNPLALYSRLRTLNPSPYMFHINMDERTSIGASPEMLIRITGDTIETFPIAGTRRTGADNLENDRLARELRGDAKELAEHTMLVDLGRNDMGKVCKPGTVRPLTLMEIKKFSHVQHMVTHLTGEMDAGSDMFDAFRAVFPAGTVSGAPKVRAMEIIDELEPQSRGPYAGAVGYFSGNGCCDFAIAIRGIFLEKNRGFIQSGAGIVYDSEPQREFAETQEKAGAMLQALREASL